MTTTGTIFDLKKFAIHDGPGIRTTVFFKGCPLNCWWCQNPEGVKLEPEVMTVKSGGDGSAGTKDDTVGRKVTAGEVMAEIKKDILFYDQSGGGVTFSGGEPLLQPDFLEELLDECRAAGIHTTVDTSGYAGWETFESIRDRVDLFLFDLKIIDDTDHLRYTGVSNALILDNLARLAASGAPIIIRVPVIPDVTDSSRNLEAMAGALKKINGSFEIDLLPYNRIAEDKFRRFGLSPRLQNVPDRSDRELKQMAGTFEAHGYEVHIGG